MANPKHLAALRQGVAAWNRWREKEIFQVNLSFGADLRGADLSRADLSGARLRGAILMRANLRGANLSGAFLRRVNVRQANPRVPVVEPSWAQAHLYLALSESGCGDNNAGSFSGWPGDAFLPE